MKVSVITCTHDRPEAMRLCARYVARQTITPWEWIVADDGVVDEWLTTEMNLIHLHRPSAPAGYASLCDNMTAALDMATGDVVVVFENDDYYASNHIEVAIKHLDGDGRSGCGVIRYYNVKHRKWRVMKNRGSALCNTAFVRELIPDMKAAVDSARRSCAHNIDGRFWGNIRAGVHDEATVIGMKGLPGTAGLGIGHRPGYGWHNDPNGAKLREWIGDDADNYVF